MIAIVRDWRRGICLGLISLLISLGAGAQEPTQLFQGRQVPPPSDRLHIKNEGKLTVATAVPSRGETKKIFGMDLYAKNVQPVWVQVENRGDTVVYL